MGCAEERWPDGPAPLRRLVFPGIDGLRVSHGAVALSALAGADIPTGAICAGVATPDGLRTPAAFALVRGERPSAERDPCWPAGGGTLTVSPRGFRAYANRDLPAGVALLWAAEPEDASGALTDPEVSLGSWSGQGREPEVVTIVGSCLACDPEDRWHFWTFFSLCPTLHPWDAPPDLCSERGERLVAAVGLSVLAWQYTLEGMHDTAAWVLGSSSGEVEMLARARLRAMDVNIPGAVGTWTVPRGPWCFGAPVDRVPVWAHAACGAINDATRARFFTARVTRYRSQGPSPLEEAACAGWSGPWVRFDASATFTIHAGSGRGGANRARRWFAELTRTRRAALNLPPTDAVVRPRGCFFLPAAAGVSGAPSPAWWLLVALATDCFRAVTASDAAAAPPPAVAEPCFVAARDRWWADGLLDQTRWEMLTDRPVRNRELRVTGSARLPQGPWGPRRGELGAAPRLEPAPSPLAWPAHATIQGDPLSDAAITAACRVLEMPPPEPGFWVALRARRRELTRASTQLAWRDSVPADAPFVTPETPEAPLHQRVGVERGRPIERFCPVPNGRAAGRFPSVHVAGTAESGWPRARTVLRSDEGSAAPPPTPDATRLVVSTVRRGILAGLPAATSDGAAELWVDRFPVRWIFGESDMVPLGSGATLRPDLDDLSTPRWRPAAAHCSAELSQVLLAVIEIALNPLTRAAGITFRGRRPVAWVRRNVCERESGHLIPAVREDVTRLLAVAHALARQPPALAAHLWSAACWPCFQGGHARRKAIATAAHVAMIRGDPYGPFDGDALLEYQRYLTRGLFAGSPTISVPPARMRAATLTLQGRPLPAGALAWIVAAARDARAERTRGGRCSRCGVVGAYDADLDDHCHLCAEQMIRAFARGGGTIAYTRRTGGAHAATAAWLAECGLSASEARPREVASSIIARAVAADSPLRAMAVMTAVYPTGQAGARDQETPSLRVALSAIVLRACWSGLVDPDWARPIKNPDAAACALGASTAGAPFIAFDAKAATDGEAFEAIEAVTAVGPRFRAGALGPVLDSATGTVRGRPLPSADITDALLDSYLRYESTTMRPDEWARRTTGTEVAADFARPLAVETPESWIQAAGQRRPVGRGITVICGPTGCGKTRLAAALDEQCPVALCLPTRLSIMTAAADAERQTGRPSAAMFFRAGELGETGDGAAVFADGQWVSWPRSAVLAAGYRLYVTPYQLRARTASTDLLAVIDEAHERSWERVIALAEAALRGRRMVLVSATPPQFALGEHLWGRPLERVELPGPALAVRIVPIGVQARDGPGLIIRGSVAKTIATAERVGGLALYGELGAVAMLEIVARAEREALTIVATMGVAASSVTLPAIGWVEIAADALKRYRYHVGSGASQSTGVTRGELLQMLGRAGRIPPHAATAFVAGCDRPGAVSRSWVEALDATSIRCEPEIWGARTDGFLAQVTALGDPALADDVAVAACEAMETTAALIPWARLARAAIDDWLGVPLAAYTAQLPEAERREFEAGLDPACAVRARQEQDARGNVHRTPAEAWTRNPVTPGAEPLGPSLPFARGLLLRLGPGIRGAFGVPFHADEDAYRELLEPLPDVPQLLAPMPATVRVGGQLVPRSTVPVPSPPSVAEAEARVVAGRTMVRNSCGTPMGGAGNGAILNAVVSAVAKAADAATVFAQRAAAGGSDWLAGLGPLVAASPSSCGGDDEAVAGDEFRQAICVILRLAAGMRLNVVKTGRTTSRGSTAAPPAGGTYLTADELRALTAAGHRFAAAPLAGTAPFLERYFTPRPAAAPSVTRPATLVTDARSLYNLFAGRSVDQAVWGRFSALAEGLFGLDFADHRALAEWAPDDPRPMLSRVGLPAARDGPTSVALRLSPELLVAFAAPTRAGRAAGDGLGVRVLRAVLNVQLGAMARSVAAVGFAPPCGRETCVICAAPAAPCRCGLALCGAAACGDAHLAACRVAAAWFGGEFIGRLAPPRGQCEGVLSRRPEAPVDAGCLQGADCSHNAAEELDAARTSGLPWHAGWWAIRSRSGLIFARPGAAVDGPLWRAPPGVWHPWPRGTFFADSAAGGAAVWQGTWDELVAECAAEPGHVDPSPAVSVPRFTLPIPGAAGTVAIQRLEGGGFQLSPSVARIAGSYAPAGLLRLPRSNAARESIDLQEIPHDWWPVARGLAADDGEFVEAARAAGGVPPPPLHVSEARAVDMLRAALAEDE